MEFDQLVEKIKYFYPELHAEFHHRNGAKIITELTKDNECWPDPERPSSYFDLHELMEKTQYYKSEFYKKLHNGKQDQCIQYDKVFEYIVDNKHKHMFWLL